MADLSLSESAADRLTRSCFRGGGYITFFTVVGDELRAWPIRDGDDAVAAAGRVHTDMARGFIRAETVAYDDFVAAVNMKGAKAAGKVRLEGKTYKVHDGDIINFRFNV